MSVVDKVLADVGEDASSAAYGDASGNTALNNKQAKFAVLVEHIWVVHEIF